MSFALCVYCAVPGHSSSFGGASTGRLTSLPSSPSPRPADRHRRTADSGLVENSAGTATDVSAISAVKQARWRQWRAEYESLPVKRLRLLAEQTGCSQSQVEKARNTDAPRESLLQLLIENRWQHLEREQAAVAKRRLMEEDSERQRGIRLAQLQQMDVKSLVDLAEQRPSISAEDLQRARDHSSPRGAIISLLQQEVVLPKPKPVPRIFNLAASGDAAAVRRKLDRGADPNEANADQTTALYRAAANGHAVVVSHLLEGRADPNRLGYLRGKKTALMAATQHGHTQTVQLLLRYGAKRNTKDEANRTALKLAQAHRQVQCEELLRTRGDSLILTDSPRLSDSENDGGGNDGGNDTGTSGGEVKPVVDM